MSVEPAEIIDLVPTRAIVIGAVIAASDTAGLRCGGPECAHVAALVLVLAAVEDPNDAEKIHRMDVELGLPNLWVSSQSADNG